MALIERTTEVVIVAAAILSLAGLANGQNIYRYQADDGTWQYTDRPPADGRKAEISAVSRLNLDPKVIVTRETTGTGTTIFADNEYHGAVEFEIRLFETTNIGGGLDAEPVHLVLPPAGKKIPVLDVTPAQAGDPMSFRYEYKYMLGEPDVEHNTDYLYAVPYAVGQRFPVSQAYPVAITHDSAESRHAIDFAMPEGTPVHAARPGTVVSIAFRSFSGGTTAQDALKANMVRIVHDDGTLATYAHLALDSVRVRPGEKVARGQYIASSGNTGFSTGPHLHFAVERNVGFSLDSIPVLFAGAGSSAVRARTGQYLQAY